MRCHDGDALFRRARGGAAPRIPQRQGTPGRGEEALVLLAEHDRQVGDAPELVLPQRAVEEEHPRQVLDDGC